ncbi:MAG: 1-acyl-sn-glycerol-3-phosphate acyltransferase [Treponemataceae bacterium]|nr:1-acyl-sn-glycerol-3-phosphate acyltransferase [Treponemataceae bacterium]
MFFDNIFATVIIWLVLSIAILYFLWFVLSWLVLIIFCLTIPMKKQYKKPSKFYKALFNYAYWMLCKLARVKVKVNGLDKIHFGKRFLLVSNHRSKFDNMIQSIVLKKENLAFISKKENFKIPIGRHYMNRMCYLSLDRSNMKSGIETIKKATDYLTNDITSIGLFPEGTRSLDGSLLPFHDACLRIAIYAKCPVVVGLIQGTENIHKNWPFKKTSVTFDIIKVIEPEEYEGKKAVELSDMVRCLMSEKLNENKNIEE